MSQPRKLTRNIHTHEHGGGRRPAWLFLLPVNTLTPLLRYPLGIQLLNPLETVTRGFVLTAGAFVLVTFYPPAALGGMWFLYFVGLSTGAGLVRFGCRFMGQQRGQRVHSEEAGYTALTRYSGLPATFCEMVLTPYALAALGWVIRARVSWLLGWWLLLGAASWFLLAWWELHVLLARRRVPVDGMVRAEVFEDDLELQGERERAYGTGGDWQPPRAARAWWQSATDSIAPDFMTWWRGRGRR